METIGARLREERERLGLTQPDFAQKVGVGKGAQINYEQNRRVPDAAYLALAAQMGADALYILTGERSRPVLSVRESALLDNYRNSPAEGKDAIEKTASALAKPGEMKKAG